MGEYSGAFVGFDTSKTKHAVAIAEGGRGGEVAFSARLPVHRRGLSVWSASWRRATTSCIFAMRRVRQATGCTGKFVSSGTTARS